MKKLPYISQLTHICVGLAGLSCALGMFNSPAQAQSRYAPNHLKPAQNLNKAQPYYHNSYHGSVYNHHAGPGYQQHQARITQARAPKKYDNIIDRFKGKRHIAYQAPPAQAPIFQQWVETEPQYKLSPGDQVDIVVATAPELSRTLTVGPDGRIVMPMSQPIVAAGRTFLQIQAQLTAELAKQLRDPSLSVTPRSYAPSQIYVGGRVNQPGTYTLPGRIGALEGIFLAGGIAPGAKSKEVAVLRRAPNGGMMMRSVNIKNGLVNIREYNDTIQLRRGDIIFVPQTTLAEVGNFVQALRNTLPLDFNISYQVGQNGFGTAIVP